MLAGDGAVAEYRDVHPRSFSILVRWDTGRGLSIPCAVTIRVGISMFGDMIFRHLGLAGRFHVWTGAREKSPTSQTDGEDRPVTDAKPRRQHASALVASVRATDRFPRSGEFAFPR